MISPDDIEIGEDVVDPEGIELGGVLEVTDGFVRLGEGVRDSFLIKLSYLVEGEEGLGLSRPLRSILKAARVIDPRGNQIGFVKEIEDLDGILDSFIIERGSELFIIGLENIEKIETTLQIDLTLEELREKD